MPIAVTTTLPDEELARALARKAVEERLAACAHIEPITSIYRWNGVQEERETRVLFKTADSAVEALKALILAEHPYEEPALSWHDFETGASYERWIEESVQGR